MAPVRPLTLRFTESARANLEGILAYISERNPDVAVHIGARIRLAAELVSTFPDAGRPGKVIGTREWVVRGLPYIIVYEVVDDTVLAILGVFHGAQGRSLG